MTGEKAVEVFKLAKNGNLLPQKIDDLIPLSFIGQAAVSFYRGRIKLMNELGMTEEQRKATLKDGQDAGELLLDIESRIGEIVEKEERALPRPVYRASGGFSSSGKPPKHERLGMPERRMQQAQKIHRHPDVVERIKAKARENEDIPTKTAVLSEIRYENEKKRREAAEKGKYPKSKVMVSLEQVEAENAIDRMILICPKKWPSTWDESVLKRVVTKAKILIRRLEVFNG